MRDFHVSKRWNTFSTVLVFSTFFDIMPLHHSLPCSVSVWLSGFCASSSTKRHDAAPPGAPQRSTHDAQKLTQLRAGTRPSSIIMNITKQSKHRR